jgi:hypothetical protein
LESKKMKFEEGGATYLKFIGSSHVKKKEGNDAN